MKSAVEERKAETREMIMQAARKVFSERGYHNAQISDIVREAGISTGSIYAHFKDKRDLFAQVTRENLENLRRLLREIRQTDRQDDDIRDRIGRMKLAYEAFFDYVDANVPQLLMILRSGYGWISSWIPVHGITSIALPTTSARSFASGSAWATSRASTQRSWGISSSEPVSRSCTPTSWMPSSRAARRSDT